MKERKSYRGKLNGVRGIWTDTKPEELKDVEEITFYQADEGKVFVNLKTAESCNMLVLKEGEKLSDYDEIDVPKEEEKAE